MLVLYKNVNRNIMYSILFLKLIRIFFFQHNTYLCTVEKYHILTIEMSVVRSHIILIVSVTIFIFDIYIDGYFLLFST